jgi:hypothetical protein
MYTQEGPIVWPVIHSIKYTRQDTALTIKFRTPSYRNVGKRTRVKIFMSGKINILGAINSVDTYIICNWLQWIFDTKSDVIVPEAPVEIYMPYRPNNIREPTASAIEDIAYSQFLIVVPNYIPLSHDEYNSVLMYVNECELRDNQCMYNAALLLGVA